MRSPLVLLLFTVLLSLSACDLPIEGGCDARQDPAPVSGCLVPVDGWGDDDPMLEQQGADLELSGTVVGAGLGEPADECVTAGGPIGHHVSADAEGAVTVDDMSWFELEDASGDRYTVAVAAGDATPVFEVGQELDVTYSFFFGGFSPDVGNLEIRQADGSLVGWVGEAGGLDGLALPDELESVTEGPAVCSQRDTGCGDWQAHDVNVIVEGVEGRVPYGATVTASDLAVAHGGYEQEIPRASQQGCPDWYVAHVTLGLFPSPI